MSARAPLLLGLAVIAALLAGLGGWGATAQLAGAVIAPGRIELDRDRHVIQHPDGGVVAALAVDEGDFVTEGDLLLRLDGDGLSAELAIVEGALTDLTARQARLRAERDGRTRLPPATGLPADAPGLADALAGQARLLRARMATQEKHRAQLRERRVQTDRQITGIAAQQKALDRQRRLLEQERADQQALLDKGLAQSARVLALQREEARLEGEIGRLAARTAELRARIAEIDLQILSLSDRRREEAIAALRDLSPRMQELHERRTELRRRLTRLEIRAPLDGVVHGLRIPAAGTVLRAADPALHLVPQDRPLVATLRIPPDRVDEVHVGQEARLRITAFASRDSADLSARLTLVSPDAFTGEGDGQTFYRGEAVPTAPLPDGLSLRPGMPVQAFLRTRDRTPLAYLLGPLTDYLDRAFREG